MISIHKETESALLLNLNTREANLVNADEFKAEIISLFDEHQKKIILNLKQVEYIDSSFLGALVGVLKHLLSFKSDLILVGLHKDIINLFKMIRLDKVFKIYDSFDELPA